LASIKEAQHKEKPPNRVVFSLVAAFGGAGFEPRLTFGLPEGVEQNLMAPPSADFASINE
jgi:hypothetical protein